MQIQFKAMLEYDCFIFSALASSTSSTNLILLPENLTLADFALLIQSSLDAIRPVVILNELTTLKEIDFNECRSNHFKILENKYIFLNFSIRNSLSKINEETLELKSFSEIENILQKFFKK